MIGSGTEQPGALMGTYPMILMSSFSGAYDAIRFENLWGYNQGTIGDIDNDGDMDIVIPNTMDCVTHTLINDGTGGFSVNDDLVLPANDIFPVELFDVNHDGYLDLIWGGGAGEKWDGKTWRAEVIWGDGTGFRSTNPISIIHRWDLISFLDFEFMDFDQDGIDEIIVPLTSQDYSNWELAVFKMVGDDFSDVTSDFFEPGENIGLGESWIVWIDIEEDEGKLFLVCQQYGDCRMYFEYKNGKFLRADEDSHFNPQNGFAVYYDAKAPISSNVGYTLSCPDNPNSGDYCIMNEPYSWGYMFKLSEAQNGTDLRQLVSDGYCIEFYARHDAPDFLVEVKFGSEAMKDQESNTFSYPYWGNEHASDGKWQRIVVPLSSFDSWNDETGESWGRINYLFFHAASETNKCPFYIDEIRIRKILSE